VQSQNSQTHLIPMPRLQHKFVSLIFAAISLAPIVMLLATFNSSMIENSIGRSHEIEREFVEVATLVDNFYTKNSRLPTQDEFRNLASIPVGNPMMYSPPPLDVSVVSEHGNPPPGGYVLDYWRGEWMEQYISWTRRSTLKFDASQYYLFHSRLAQAVSMSCLALLCVVMSTLAWPNKKPSSVLG
jgi:hypothetical protein